MILVVGATGSLGSLITRRLLAQGRAVRILVRPGSAYQPLVEAGAQPVFGDLKAPASLVPACAGISTVITTANSALRPPPDTIETVDKQGNRHLIDTARNAGVHHFIYVSAYGAEEQHPVPLMEAKAQTEAYLQASGLSYTILSPNVFMEIWVPMAVGIPATSGQPVTLVGEGRRHHAFVSINDVAAYAVAAVENPAALNQRLPIGGPAAVSWREVVALVEQVLGYPIRTRMVAPGEPVPTVPPPAWPLFAAFELFDSPIPMIATARTFGVPPTSLETVVRGMYVTTPAAPPPRELVGSIPQ
jgi:NADH dehydrogenase